jgi:RNA polymerase sigma-70 factor (TIGR02960 family)
MANADFDALALEHRRALQLHAYRLLGSLQDAEDVVQETLLAAWQGLEGFEGRASARTWLYRIATNRSLNLIRDRKRRPPPAPADLPEPTRYGDTSFVEPFPDPLPEAEYEQRETVELAFIFAIQELPPQQRAALVLHEALGFRTPEIAEMLDTTPTAVKGALQRARAGVPQDNSPAPTPFSAQEQQLATAFADAVRQGDIDAVVDLLDPDCVLRMPPLPHVYEGHADIARFLRDRQERRGVPLELTATRANTQPAFTSYAHDEPWGLIVLTLTGGAVAGITWFADTTLLPKFEP